MQISDLFRHLLNETVLGGSQREVLIPIPSTVIIKNLNPNEENGEIPNVYVFNNTGTDLIFLCNPINPSSQFTSSSVNQLYPLKLSLIIYIMNAVADLVVEHDSALKIRRL